MKILAILSKGLRYLLFLVLFLIGVLCIRLAEPWYGIAFLLLSFSQLPQFWKLCQKIVSFSPKPKIKYAFSLTLTGLILAGVTLQGRKTYDRKENISASALDSLSIHPIHKRVVRGLDYYFIEAGEGEPVFLLHGFPDMANTWDETVTELSKNHRVIAPFLRGYYPSGIPKDGEYAVKTIAEDIVELANQLGIDTFNVAGQDWGASISYSVANLAPDRVKRVVAIAIPHPSCFELSPGLIWAGRHFIMFSFQNYSVRYTRKNDFAYIHRLYRRWSPDYENYQESSLPIVETFKFPGRLEAALGYYWSFNAEQGDEKRAAFYQRKPQVPVLFIGGEHDAGVTQDGVDCMQASMPPGSKSVLLKNSGHFLHHEVPEQFYAEIKGFLSGGSR